MLRLAALLAILLVPMGAAQETLASLEEPHRGTDKLWDVTVTAEEANSSRALVIRNAVGTRFSLVVYDAGGAEVFVKNGTRGIQTLPGLAEGSYRFFVRANGEFQVTANAFERTIRTESVQSTLNGTVDAYVLAASKPYNVSFEGNVSVEWLDMTGAPEEFEAPAQRAAAQGGAYVMTLRGEPGAPYAIVLTPTDPPATTATSEAPGAPIVALLGIAAVAALILKRRT